MLSEQASPHCCLLHVFIHSLSLSLSLSLSVCVALFPLLGPNITSGGWKHESKTLVVREENCAVKISDQLEHLGRSYSGHVVRKLSEINPMQDKQKEIGASHFFSSHENLLHEMSWK